MLRPVAKIALVLVGFALVVSSPKILATPANKAALKRHYDSFLSESLNRCTTCHLPSDKKNPESLDEFPHNDFGKQVRALADRLKTKNIPARLEAAASEDADQ